MSNAVDSEHNSYGTCQHGTELALHCTQCEVELLVAAAPASGDRERIMELLTQVGLLRETCAEVNRSMYTHNGVQPATDEFYRVREALAKAMRLTGGYLP